MTMTMTEKYQEIFNDKLRIARKICNATGNQNLANEIVKLFFDLSDELKNNNLLTINKDIDNDIEKTYNR